MNTGAVSPLARTIVLTGVAALGLGAYLDLRPAQPWILWLTAFLAGLATDGLIRSNPRWENDGYLSALVYTLLPALGILGAGLFIDRAITGYGRLGGALAGSVAVGVVAYGEYQTVDFGSRLYGTVRLVMAVATYLTAFSLYTVIFSTDLDLPLAAFLVGVVSLALSMELLRESRLTSPSSLLVGLAIGVSLAELRLCLYFFALDGLLAGALLIIAFYLATGLVHHLLDHDLEWSTTAEYLLVAGVGTAAVVFTRVFV
jgi:hypothetical protein